MRVNKWSPGRSIHGHECPRASLTFMLHITEKWRQPHTVEVREQLPAWRVRRSLLTSKLLPNFLLDQTFRDLLRVAT
jgi:hypothetical protein